MTIFGVEVREVSDLQMEIFYGWVIVFLCIMCKILKCQGQNNIMTYSIPHLLEDFQLSHSELSTCFSLATVSASFFQPFLGRCVDRLGARVCVPAAQFAMCLTLLCFSATQRVSPPPLQYGIFVLLFLFLRGLSLGACETFTNACIQKWFVQRRGRVTAAVNLAQTCGNGGGAIVISQIVANQGWRFAMRCGALGNIIMVLPGLLLLRRTPEDCGLQPDGISQVPSGSVAMKQVDSADEELGPTFAAEEELDQVNVADQKLEQMPVALEDSEHKVAKGKEEETLKEVPNTLPSGLFPLYAFSFFYAVIFGGCDFEMVYMFEEADGGSGTISIAHHVFLPMAIVIGIGQPFVGTLTDRMGQSSRGFANECLCCCGFFTFLCTVCLPWASDPALAILYAVVRGSTGAIFSILLTSGLAFAEFGVDRTLIGSALGYNQSAILAGTAFGPLLFGVGYDLFGSFRGTLVLTSLPPLVLFLYFGSRALHCHQLSASSGKTTSKMRYKKVLEKSSPKKKVGAAHVMGRTVNWEAVPSCPVDDSRPELCEEEDGQAEMDMEPAEAEEVSPKNLVQAS